MNKISNGKEAILFGVEIEIDFNKTLAYISTVLLCGKVDIFINLKPCQIPRVRIC